jgi:hypothetical protein
MRTCRRFTLILAIAGTTSSRAFGSDASIDAFSIRQESSYTARTSVVARERRDDAGGAAPETVGAMGGSDGAMDAFESRRISSPWSSASADQPRLGAGLSVALDPLGASDGAYDTFAARPRAKRPAAEDDHHGVISREGERRAGAPGDARAAEVERDGLGSGDQ